MKIVEYLESTGTQYINTGFKANNNTSVDCVFEQVGATSSSSIFGGRISNASKNYCCTIGGTGNVVFYSGYNNSTQSSGVSLVIGDKYTINKDKGNTYLNGTLLTTKTNLNFSCENNMYIFAMNQNESTTMYAKIKIYSLKVYDNGTIIRDYVPALDDNDIPCLYDQVNNQFYYNQGTGDFSFGNVIESSVYVGVSGVARKVTDIYVGVNNVARKVIKAYVGVYGIARLIFDNTQQIVTRTISKYTSSISSLANSRAPCTGQTQDYAIFGPR